MPRSRWRITIRAAMILVVLAAVGSWLATLYNRALAARDQEWCRIQLTNFAMAVVYYQGAKGTFPPGTMPGGALPPEQRVSWVPLIWSWTDYSQGLTYLFEPDRPWDAPENLLPRIQLDPAGGTPSIIPSPGPPEFRLRCPSNQTRLGPGLPVPLHYVGIAGLGVDAPTLPAGHPRAGVFGYDRRTAPGDIVDGTSVTMLLAETTVGNGPWTAGGPATVRGLDPGRPPYIGPGGQFGGAHPGGAMVAFADGSVRFLREAIDPKVFEALSTIAGGEALPQEWDR